MLGLETQRSVRRRPSLTPMIDVVFLLLVFFMLAARFGAPLAQPIALAAPGGTETYEGPPRLVEIGPDALRLNGLPVIDLPGALRPLMQNEDDTVILRALPGTSVQRLVDVTATLKDAGFTGMAVVE